MDKLTIISGCLFLAADIFAIASLANPDWINTGESAGQLGICYLLLNAAADIESPVGEQTPLQLAEAFGNETIIGLLKMHVKRFKLENKMLGLPALEF